MIHPDWSDDDSESYEGQFNDPLVENESQESSAIILTFCMGFGILIIILASIWR